MPEELSLNNPLAIVGDEDVVSGFKALGFKVYAVKAVEEFKSALDDILNNQTAVCLVQEDIYNMDLGRINAYRNLPVPIFIPFSKSEKTVLLDNIVKDIRLKATGVF